MMKENKYKAGDTVYAKIKPDVKLVVRRYIDRIYYCKFFNESNRKELALFESEIVEK